MAELVKVKAATMTADRKRVLEAGMDLGGACSWDGLNSSLDIVPEQKKHKLLQPEAVELTLAPRVPPLALAEVESRLSPR